MTSQYQRKLPNWLTMLRIVLIPLIIASFYIDRPLTFWVTAGLFALASITDFFDGYLAREWKVESRLGQFLDPIADKLLVATVILMLVAEGRTPYIEIPALLILLREILVSGLREFLAQLQVAMPVSKAGKIKTTLQMMALGLLLLAGAFPDGWRVQEAGGVMLWAAAILTVHSGYVYLRTGLKYMD